MPFTIFVWLTFVIESSKVASIKSILVLKNLYEKLLKILIFVNCTCFHSSIYIGCLLLDAGTNLLFSEGVPNVIGGFLKEYDTGIGDPYSQTISVFSHRPCADVNFSYKRKAELTQSALFINDYSELLDIATVHQLRECRDILYIQ
jgi:hypothetical protein